MSEYSLVDSAELAQTRQELRRHLEDTGRREAFADGLVGVEFQSPAAKQHAQEILGREIQYRDGRMVAPDGQTDASVYIRNRIRGADFSHFAKSVPAPQQAAPTSFGEAVIQRVVAMKQEATAKSGGDAAANMALPFGLKARR